MKKFNLYIPIYERSLTVAVPTKEKDMIALGLDDYAGFAATYGAIACEHENGALVLAINETSLKASRAFIFGLVAHEVTHLVGYVLKSAGVESSFDNDEPAAYLTQYIFTHLFEKIESWVTKPE